MNSISSTIWPLGLQLGRARAEAHEFDVQPWKSSSPAVLDAWESLINPINLVALEALQKESHKMNPAAKMGVSKALELCRELSRKKSETLKRGYLETPSDGDSAWNLSREACLGLGALSCRKQSVGAA
jgi:hypothetical protein